jgi:hypothetical protein
VVLAKEPASSKLYRRDPVELEPHSEVVKAAGVDAVGGGVTDEIGGTLRNMGKPGGTVGVVAVDSVSGTFVTLAKILASCRSVAIWLSLAGESGEAADGERGGTAQGRSGSTVGTSQTTFQN